jgi:hypothetical protein
MQAKAERNAHVTHNCVRSSYPYKAVCKKTNHISLMMGSKICKNARLSRNLRKPFSSPRVTSFGKKIIRIRTGTRVGCLTREPTQSLLDSLDRSIARKCPVVFVVVDKVGGTRVVFVFVDKVGGGAP